ncbi:MAG: intracellular septation protein A [Brevundimonas subvibrioides]|uniref:Inner membrane-spanning protein YciB n=1 Tax=Brevundimonas subvibrioides TaxID=74313 RepID=A0A258HGI8_9CAUL|nr:septation protein IspZ [Brevundimonas subvibrioides]OYX56026.1 MAG: intracellular septation protein A [Brevundimonas subvibrioides]
MTDMPEPKRGPPTWIRQVVDFGALAAFAATFIFFRVRGLPGDEALVHATWGLVAGSGVAVAVGLMVEKRLALMPLLVGGFALVFGVLTLVFNDDLFVKLKVTVLNASLAVALLGGLYLGKQPLKALLGSVIPVNDAAWRTLTFRYGLYFAAVAVVNEGVRSEALVAWAAAGLGHTTIDPADVWVSFRGVLWIASSIFGLSQVPLIMKNLVSEEPVDASAPARPDTAP